MISSATVEAWAYSLTTNWAYLAMNVPPTPNIAMIVGTIQESMSANFQFLTNAMTKAEKKDAREDRTTAIYVS